jgi:hypothetical protein
MAKKKSKKKKKRLVEVFDEPSRTDLLMAKAYGGQAKATVKRKAVPYPNSRMAATPMSNNLARITNSVSGFHNNNTN